MVIPTEEGVGPLIRRQRRKLALTLDELSAMTGVSKPYLSLIENQRLANPPSDPKLRRIEQALGFPAGDLVTQAHWQRTPPDVREMVLKLSERNAPNISPA